MSTDDLRTRIKRVVYRNKALYATVAPVYHTLNRSGGFSSKQYWQDRYDRGGTSGAGSYGHLAEYKAEFLNDFVVRHNIGSVIEIGCGDGAQLGLFRFPRYIGLDVSTGSIGLCMKRFEGDQSKSFYLYDAEYVRDQHHLFRAELAISLDVIYHLVSRKVNPVRNSG